MSREKKNLAESSAAKKATVLGSNSGKKGRTAMLLLAVSVVLVIGIGAFLLVRSPVGGTPVQTVATNQQGSEVTYPASLFDDGKARFYEYRTPGGLAVRYFVLKSSDGVIRAAFDACDSCWHAGKGYYQKGDDMVCRNCQLHFASVKVNEVKGGCNPAPLARRVVDGTVVIRVEDITAGQGYFDLSREG